MSDLVSATKLTLVAVIAGAAAPAAADAIRRVEEVLPIIGVSASVLFVALAGAFMGVVLLPPRDTDRMDPSAHLKRAPKAVQLAVRWAAIFVALFFYAVLAAWLVALATAWFPLLKGSPEVPLAGISGVVIRRMLPGYMRVLERVTGGIGGDKA